MNLKKEITLNEALEILGNGTMAVNPNRMIALILREYMLAQGMDLNLKIDSTPFTPEPE